MNEELQKKLVDGILGVFKDASKEVIKSETKPADTTEDDDTKVEKDNKETETKVESNGVTQEQFVAGLTKMGETIMGGVAELLKTPDQKAEEQKVVAVDAVKNYLATKGFDVENQAINITFSETKKGGGVDDGGLELKLVKDGKELVEKSEDSEDGDNQFKTVKDIPDDVKKEAHRSLWKQHLKL